jgi:hypothetical protein
MAKTKVKRKPRTPRTKPTKKDLVESRRLRFPEETAEQTAHALRRHNISVAYIRNIIAQLKAKKRKKPAEKPVARKAKGPAGPAAPAPTLKDGRDVPVITSPLTLQDELTKLVKSTDVTQERIPIFLLNIYNTAEIASNQRYHTMVQALDRLQISVSAERIEELRALLMAQEQETQEALEEHLAAH